MSPTSCHLPAVVRQFTLWSINVAIQNGPVIVDLPYNMVIFHTYVAVYQRVLLQFTPKQDIRLVELRTQLCDRGVKQQRFNYVAAADENPWLQELDLEDGKAGKCHPRYHVRVTCNHG